jgi:hypothetical protein
MMRFFLVLTLITCSVTAGAVISQSAAAPRAPQLAALGSVGYSAVMPFESCLGDHCTFANTTLDEVSVPAGASWRLDDVVVEGTLTVGAGASLHAIGTVVRGDLISGGAAWLELVDTTVEGEVRCRVDLLRTLVGGFSGCVRS